MKTAKFVDFLNPKIRWSNLSKFGTSNFGRLTVLAPVVGFLVFRNDALNGYLQLVEVESKISWYEHLSGLRLELFYLGLVFIGISVGLFTMFAPQQIRDHPLYSSFLAVKIETSTPDALQFSFDKTIGLFSSKIAGLRNFAHFKAVVLPSNYHEGYKNFLLQVFEEQINKPEEAGGTGVSDYDPSEFPARLKAEKLSRRDIAELRKNLASNGSDIYRFEYIFAEYVGFKRRALVFSTFGIGVLITFLPTLLTTLSILSKVLFGTNSG